MNYFLTGEFSNQQKIEFFEEDLSVFSFNELRAKPDTALFTPIVATLNSKYNTKASEAIFVGKLSSLHSELSRQTLKQYRFGTL